MLGRDLMSSKRQGKQRATAMEGSMNRVSPNFRASRASMMAADALFEDASGNKEGPDCRTSATSSDGLRRFLEAAQSDTAHRAAASSTTANHHGEAAGVTPAVQTVEKRINQLEEMTGTDLDGDGDIGEDGHFNRDLEA